MTDHYKDKTWYIFGPAIDTEKSHVIADVDSVDTDGNVYLVDQDGVEYEMTVNRWRQLIDDGYIVAASNVDEDSWEVGAFLTIVDNADIHNDSRPRSAAHQLFQYAGGT